MKLYICWGTFRSPRPGGHPCRNAYIALREAGWDPDLQKVHGLGAMPAALTPTRSKVRELTGQNWVPVLVTDDDDVIRGSHAIVAWAAGNAAPGAERSP